MRRKAIAHQFHQERGTRSYWSCISTAIKLAKKTAPAANVTQVRRAINSRCCSCASASPAISAVKVATAPGISIDKAGPFSNCHRPGSMAPGLAVHQNAQITSDFGDNNRNRSRADAGDGIDQRRGDDQGLGRSSVVLPVSR